MKTKLYILMLAVSVVLAASCEDYLTVKLYDQANLEEIFSKSNTTHRYLRQLYSYIPEDESVDNREGWVVSRSDEAQNSAVTFVHYLSYRTGNYSPATAGRTDNGEDDAYRPWNEMYKAINQCTIFMNNVDLDKEDSAGDREYMKAQARFLRAYFYYVLFRQYGPVFLWMDSDYNAVTPDESLEGATVDRHTVDQNVRFIVSELDKAIEALPLRVGDNDLESTSRWTGMATKGAAMAVKSRVLLMAASPLYNGCDLYKGQMRNLRGDYLFPQTADASKWDKAADAAYDLIKLAEDEGLYELVKDQPYPSGSQYEDTPQQHGAWDYEQVFHTKWNKEIVWGWWKRESSEYSYLWGNGQQLALTLPPAPALHYHGFAHVSPSLKLVDAFPVWETGRYPVTGYESTGGRLDYSRPIVDAESHYQSDGWTENYKAPVNTPWAPAFKAHNSTVGRDPRYYASLVPNGWPWPNANKAKFFSCYNSAECISQWAANGDHNRVGYVWRKWYPTDLNLDDNNSYHIYEVYPSIRLAEIYLNYAEAMNERSARNGAVACEYINKVRNRVGLNNIEDAYPGIEGNQALLRWVIRIERMCEFNGEAVRHYDAVRWMIAKDEYTTKNWTLKLSATTYEESYERVSDDFVGGDPTFTDRDYLFPLSNNQLSEMTNITQNYGW